MHIRLHRHSIPLLRRYSSTDTLVLGPGGQASIVASAGNNAPGGAGEGSLFNSPGGQDAPEGGNPLLQPVPEASAPAVTSDTQSLDGAQTQLQTASQLSVATTAPTSSDLISAVSQSSLTPSSSLSPSSSPTLSSSQFTSASTTATSSDFSAASSSSQASSAATAVTIPTATATPSAGFAITHRPVFYVGVALGSAVAIAILAALITWYVKSRGHAKRRREFVETSVPWGKKPDEGNRPDMEEARDNNNFDIQPASNGGAMGGDAGVGTWNARADRHVGEPRRSDSFLLPPVKRKGFNPFTDSPPKIHSTGTLADSLVFPLDNGPYPTPRPLPPHLSSAVSSIHMPTRTLGHLTVANMMPGDVSSSGDGSSRPGTSRGAPYVPTDYGTPREPASSRPRFMGLGGEGLKVPWAPTGTENTTARAKMSGNNRNWETLPSFPTAGNSQPEAVVEQPAGWRNSWRSSLANAFHAVAGNTSSTEDQVDEDKLTPAPRRVSETIQSLRADQGQPFAPEQGISRVSTGQTSVTVTSRPWVLEETAPGTGVVHVRGLEAYNGADHAWAPGPSQTTLYLDNGNDDRASNFTRIATHESQAPLIIHKKPPAAKTKSFLRVKKIGGVAEEVAPENSIHSSASLTSSVYRYYGRESPPPQLPAISPALSRNSTASTIKADKRPRGSARKSDKSKKSAHRKKSRPKIMTRNSSSKTAGSALSFGSDLSRASEKLTDKEEVAKKALRERRKRLARTQAESSNKKS